MNVPGRGGDEGGGGEDDQRGRRGRRRLTGITWKTMATFDRMHVRPRALAFILTLWAAASAVVAVPESENSARGPGKICGVPGTPPCNSPKVAPGPSAAASGGRRRVCGVPGAPPCKASEEDSEEGAPPNTYDEDIYGAYETLEYGEEQENATRLDGSIPVLEAFPILEPRPPQHPQMMLQEAPPFTWLVQSDTPPRQNKEPEGEFGVDGDGNSLLGGLSGLKGRARKGGSGGGSSRERRARSLKKAREKRAF